jgi:hypothetical protein
MRITGDMEHLQRLCIATYLDWKGATVLFGRGRRTELNDHASTGKASPQPTAALTKLTPRAVESNYKMQVLLRPTAQLQIV